jgi:hypothetical protein
VSEIAYYRSGLAGRQSRAVSRELARSERNARLGLARINHQADLQAERISAVAYVGKRALHETAMLGQLEVQLSALVPAATPRLQ